MERAYPKNKCAMLRETGSTKKYRVRKQTAECLVNSKLDYASVVFDLLPAYQLRHLQRVQNARAGFVLRKYANETDLVTLNWLDIAKRRKLSVLKLSFKSLNDTNFPEYLRLGTQAVSAYNLRSSVAPLLFIPKESGTFKDTAATFFSILPTHVRNIKDYGLFCKSIMPLLKCPRFDSISMTHRHFIFIYLFILNYSHRIQLLLHV